MISIHKLTDAQYHRIQDVERIEKIKKEMDDLAVELDAIAEEYGLECQFMASVECLEVSQLGSTIEGFEKR